MSETTKKFLNRHYIFEFLLMIFLSIFFDISFRARFALEWHLKYLILSQISNILIIFIIMMFRSKTKRFVAYNVYIVILLGLFVTDTCLFYFKQDLFSLGMIKEIPNGLAVGIKYNIFAAFSFWYWILIFVLAGLIITALYFIVYKNPMRQRFTHGAKFFVLFLLVTFLSLSGTTKNILISKDHLGQYEEKLFETPQDKRSFVMTFGLNNYRTQDFLHSTATLLSKPLQKENSRKHLDNSIDKLTPIRSSSHGLFADKNLILILCETTEEYAIDEKLTPTLYKLFYGDNSLRFNNMYTSAKLDYTYDAEFTALTSMMYMNNDNLMRTFANNTFTNSLPSVLRANGYTANSFHGYYGDFFNRINMHEALGFEKYYHNDDIEFSEYKGWPLDSELFEQMVEKIAPADQDEPFFSFVITVTPHGPHDYLRPELSEYYEIIAEDGRYSEHEIEFQTILAAQMDLDRALKTLLDHLEEENLSDDTVITLFADHKNYSSFHITEKYSDISDETFIHEFDKIPYAIYNPNIKGRDINLLTSQYDIAPTLFDLFGIAYYEEYYYGQSILLADTNEYEKRINILGYNRWISEDIVLYEKNLIYISVDIENVDEFILECSNQVSEYVERFHALFYADYFLENQSFQEK